MSSLNHSAASLRVFGDDLKPDEISATLGCSPTESWLQGDVQTFKSGRTFTKKSGAWFLRAPQTEPEDLNGQVEFLFSKATSDLGVWRDLCAKYEVDLFCGWFMGTSNDGVSISPTTLSLLAERGIELSLDIYAPSQEAQDA